MANIICVIELYRNQPRPVCLEALGQARRIATRLGATLFALVPLSHVPRYGDDEFIPMLGRHGADKVLLLTDETLGDTAEPLRWGAHGQAICAVTELLPPSLLLFGSTAGARDVAPRVAAHIGAALLTDAWVEIADDQLLLWEGSGETARGIDGDLEFPVVATIPPGRYAAASGDDEVEVEVVPVSQRVPDFEELGWEQDPRASRVVLGADEALSTKLAAALGGAGTQLPRDGSPQLCVSFGPSLAGVRADVKVALGQAASAEAHYAFAGDAEALLAALSKAKAAT